jgi:DNA (cytosine-5)-methyltransferase 1
MRTVDLFSGCGGLSLGLQRAGFEVVAAFDNWQPAIEVYEQNFTDHPIIKLDLGNLNGDYSEIASFKGDFIVGGPPCQDFSSAGNRDETAGKGDLTPVFAEIVTTLKPRWALMENVDQAVKSQRYQRAKQMLIEAGYGITLTVLDASLCGVPQKRKRLFLIAELGGEDAALLPYLQKNLSAKPTTIRDYLGESLGIEHYYRHPRNYNRRGIYSIDEPSPTVRGVNRPVPGGYPGHRADSAPLGPAIRPLTTIERSYLQTFPKTFKFTQTKTNLEQMIGNAVPVDLAKYVGLAIQEYIADNQ